VRGRTLEEVLGVAARATYCEVSLKGKEKTNWQIA
jgi:hypothetical protein